MIFESDFYNTTAENDEFYLLPAAWLDWWGSSYKVYVAFLCWKGWVGIKVGKEYG